MLEDSSDFVYPRAPIVEAVMELRFSEVAASKVRKTADILRSKYDNYDEEDVLEGNLDFVTRSASFKERSQSFKLSSADQAESLNISPTNAVWVRLAPYEGWSNFCGRISDQLPKVLKLLGAPRISRIGLRFVNRIDFPILDELGYPENYLSFRIETGELLDPHNGFGWVLKKVFLDRKMAATVQSATIPSELPRHGAITFDIDISVEVDTPWKSEEILERLVEMRKLKNEIFEAGITDKARELFNAAKP